MKLPRRTVHQGFLTFVKKCEGRNDADTAKACRDIGNSRLNAAAVEVDPLLASQNYDLAFRYLDKGSVFEENFRDPLYLWAYAQACYFTGRFHVAIQLHHLLIHMHRQGKGVEFYGDLVLQAAIVLKHIGEFKQSRDLFCYALKKIPSRYSMESILVQVCRCMELSGNISGCAEAYFELFMDCFASKLREERATAILAHDIAGAQAARVAAHLSEHKESGDVHDRGVQMQRSGTVQMDDEPNVQSEESFASRKSTMVAFKLRPASRHLSRTRSNITSTALDLSGMIEDTYAIAAHAQTEADKTGSTGGSAGAAGHAEIFSVSKLHDEITSFDEFREWFWNPLTWTHFGDLYVKTVDVTLAADAYCAATQRYESTEDIPDGLLVKAAKACMSSRNFDTARVFVDLLVCYS